MSPSKKGHPPWHIFGFVEAADPLRRALMRSHFLLRGEVQIREALAQRADDLSNLAPLLEWDLDHHTRGNVVKHLLEDVAQLISNARL